MSRADIRVLGVSGGIGSGKSVVSRLLGLLGIPVFDCDREAKALYDSDAQLKKQLLVRFGEGLYPEGRFASRALAQIIFEDPLARREVEQMVHPAVLRRFDQWKQQQGRPLVALESAILFSSGFDKFCTDILWVDAPEEERLQRIVQRDGATREEAMRRIEAQRNNTPPEGSRVYRIDNSADQALLPAVRALVQELLP